MKLTTSAAAAIAVAFVCASSVSAQPAQTPGAQCVVAAANTPYPVSVYAVAGANPSRESDMQEWCSAMTQNGWANAGDPTFDFSSNSTFTCRVTFPDTGVIDVWYQPDPRSNLSTSRSQAYGLGFCSAWSVRGYDVNWSAPYPEAP